MIIVNCPHCGKEHMLYPEKIEDLIRKGKTVIADYPCGRLFTVEQGDDCYFTK